MTNPQQNALAEALERIARSKYGLQNIQEDHGHDTNAYNFHAMKYYQRLAHEYEQTARQALASNNPAAVEGQGEAVAFDILWPLQEWDGREDVCRAAARAVTAALASNSGGED